MLKHVVMISVATVMVLMSSTLFAQGMPQDKMPSPQMPFGKWWQHPGALEELKLTNEEIRTLDDQFNNKARTFIKLKHAVELEQFEMDRLLESETLDEAALIAQFDKLEKARANLSKENFLYLIQVRKILGHERFQALRVFGKKMHRQKRAGFKHGDRKPQARP